MARTRSNMTDYFKETVAVVTNPSIDRERERSQFSTRVLLGARPNIGQVATEENRLLELETPLLLGGHPGLAPAEVMREVANAQGTCPAGRTSANTTARLLCACPWSQKPAKVWKDALKRLQRAAV